MFNLEELSDMFEDNLLGVLCSGTIPYLYGANFIIDLLKEQEDGTE